MEDPSGQLILLRHGESEANAADRFAGTMDVPLTAKGERESADAGRRILASGAHLTAAYSSRLVRSMRSAEIVLSALGGAAVPLKLTSRLNERNYGDLEGRRRSEVRAEYGQRQFGDWRRSYSVRPPNGESLEDVVARIRPSWEEIRADAAGGTVLVVSHGNVIRALVTIVEGLSPEAVAAVEVPTATPLLYSITTAGESIGAPRYLAEPERIPSWISP